jgi:hypothetical protein
MLTLRARVRCVRRSPCVGSKAPNDTDPSSSYSASLSRSATTSAALLTLTTAVAVVDTLVVVVSDALDCVRACMCAIARAPPPPSNVGDSSYNMQ